MKIWESLTDRGRVNWFILCRQHDVTLSDQDKRDIHIEARVEELSEIKDMMEEAPNYTISKQGRA